MPPPPPKPTPKPVACKPTAEVKIKYVNLVPILPPKPPTPVVSHLEIGVQTEFDYESEEFEEDSFPASPTPSPSPIPPPTPKPVMESVATNTDFSLGMANEFERITAVITSDKPSTENESRFDEWSRKAERLKFAGMMINCEINIRTPSPNSDQNLEGRKKFKNPKRKKK